MRLNRLGPAGALASLLALGACAAGPPVAGFDGVYRGTLQAQLGASPESCPRVDDPADATMVIRDGRARVEAIRAAYFNGQVSADGTLTMISVHGRFAVITGRIVGGTYRAQGSGVCQYDVRMTRVAPGT